MQSFINPSIKEMLKQKIISFVEGSLDEEQIIIDDMGVTLVRPMSQVAHKYAARGVVLLPFSHEGVTVLYFPTT